MFDKNMAFTGNSEVRKRTSFYKFRDATLFLLLWDFESEYTETETSRVSGQRPKTSSVQGTRIEENVKKSVAPVEPMPKHRCIRCPGACEAPVEPTASRQASVHWAYYVPEMMSSDQEKILQLRMNR